MNTGTRILTIPVVCLLAAMSFGSRCNPPPPTDGGPVTNPSSWTDTARTVIEAAGWVIPAAKLVTDHLLTDPARTIVGRSLDGVGEWVARLTHALDAYTEAGGDSCPSHAAALGLRVALMDACRVLIEQGFALGRPIERIIDGLGTLIDNIVPACADAGWASARREMDSQVNVWVQAQEAQGRVLRRDLDNLTPPAGAR